MIWLLSRSCSNCRLSCGSAYPLTEGSFCRLAYDAAENADANLHMKLLQCHDLLTWSLSCCVAWAAAKQHWVSEFNKNAVFCMRRDNVFEYAGNHRGNVSYHSGDCVHLHCILHGRLCQRCRSALFTLFFLSHCFSALLPFPLFTNEEVHVIETSCQCCSVIAVAYLVLQHVVH